MKILICGAAGYLGSSLAKKFLDAGHQIIAIDNLLYAQGALVASIFTHPNCDFHKVDCMDFETEKIVKQADVIFWLPAIVGGPACDKNPDEARRINTVSLGWLSKLLSPRQRVIFLCSSSGYGSANILCDEQTPMQSISLYGITKEAGENIIMQHPRAVALRLATVFGYSPRMRLDLIVNDLTFKALKYKKLSLYQGDFKRAYVSIQDVVDTLYKMRLDSRTDGEIYNLSSDNATKSDLVKYITDWIPECEVSYTDEEDYDKRSYFLNCAKIQELGYMPRHNLRESILDLIKVYKFLDIKDELYMRNI